MSFGNVVIGSFSTKGGLLSSRYKQKANFEFFPKHESLSPKLSLSIGLTDEDRGVWFNDPRSLRFDSVVELDRFFVHFLRARYFFMKRVGFVTGTNRFYRLKKDVDLLTLVHKSMFGDFDEV